MIELSIQRFTTASAVVLQAVSHSVSLSCLSVTCLAASQSCRMLPSVTTDPGDNSAVMFWRCMFVSPAMFMMEKKVMHGRADEVKSELRGPSFRSPLRFARSTKTKGLQPFINKSQRHENIQH